MTDAAASYGTPAEALRSAVVLVGGQSALGRLIGKTQPTVSRMLKEGRSLPAEDVRAVAEATRIPPHALRPDIFPEGVPAAAAPAPAGPPSLFDQFGGAAAMAEVTGIPLATLLRYQDGRAIDDAGDQRAILDAARGLSLLLTAEDVIWPFPEDRAAS